MSKSSDILGGRRWVEREEERGGRRWAGGAEAVVGDGWREKRREVGG